MANNQKGPRHITVEEADKFNNEEQNNDELENSEVEEISEDLGDSDSEIDLMKDAQAVQDMLSHKGKKDEEPESPKEEFKSEPEIKSEKFSEKSSIHRNKDIEKLKADLEAKDLQLKRLAADFDNYRRRQGIEREDLLKYAGEKLILDILPVLDNFERALNSSKDAKDVDAVISGVELIQKQLFDAILKNGVSVIEALDKEFDPNFHEAVQQIVDDEKPDQTVVNELQKGYTLSGRVIRPSMVIVSTTSG